MERKTFVSRRVWWSVLVLALLVGVSLALVLAPARATHVTGHTPLEFMERVQLGDPGKYGAIFVYCDYGYRVWVATTPNGNPAVYAIPASGTACQAPPLMIKP
jgi:hypothetical protein